MSRVDKIIKNTASNAVLRLTSMLISFISLPILVHELGQTNYGIVTIATAFMGYFGLLALGLPGGIAKFVAEYSSTGNRIELNRVVNSGIILFFCIGAIVACATCLFVFLGGTSIFNLTVEDKPHIRNVLMLAGLFAIVSWPLGVLSTVLEGLQEFHSLNIRRLVIQIAVATTSIVLAKLGYALEIVFSLICSAGIAEGIACYFLLKNVRPDWAFCIKDWEPKTISKVFSFSAWLLLGQLAVLLTYNADQLIIASLLPVSTVTIYLVVTLPFRQVQQFSSLLVSAIMPSVSHDVASQGMIAAKRYLEFSLPLHNKLVMPVACSMSLFCLPFLGLWMGAEYRQYAWLASAACMFQVVWQAFSVLGPIASGAGVVRALSILALLTAILNVSLSYLLTYLTGFQGVIWGTIIAGTISIAFVCKIVLPKFTDSPTILVLNTSVKIGLICVMTAAVFWWLFGERIAGIDSWLAFLLWFAGYLILNYAVLWKTVTSLVEKSWLNETVKRFFSYGLVLVGGGKRA